jgi:hypothetical protein
MVPIRERHGDSAIIVHFKERRRKPRKMENLKDKIIKWIPYTVSALGVLALMLYFLVLMPYSWQSYQYIIPEIFKINPSIGRSLAIIWAFSILGAWAVAEALLIFLEKLLCPTSDEYKKLQKAKKKLNGKYAYPLYLKECRRLETEYKLKKVNEEIAKYKKKHGVKA